MHRACLIISVTCLVLLAGIMPAYSQTIPAGSPVFEEALRRKQLLGELDSSVSFNIRPLRSNFLTEQSVYRNYSFFKTGSPNLPIEGKTPKMRFSVLPLQNTVQFNSGRPYGWGNGIIIPNVGGQNFTTAGISAKFHFLNIQIQPELLWAQNRSYDGFPDTYPDVVNRRRFGSWNQSDNPERFGEGAYSKIWWGQSKFSLSAGAFELGVSTE